MGLGLGHYRWIATIGIFVVSSAAFSESQLLRGSGTHAAPATASVAAAYGRLPLEFEANAGQADPSVDFVAHWSSASVFLTRGEATLFLRPRPAQDPKSPLSVLAPKRLQAQDEGVARPGSTSLSIKLIGANPTPAVAGLSPLPGIANYLVGGDPRAWRTHIPTYARVAYARIYRGVDLEYYGSHQGLESDFVVAPGADPSVITLWADGANKVVLDAAGNLVLALPNGEISLQKPFIYQDVAGVRRQILGEYGLKSPDRFGFRVGKYDLTRPLVIDPVIVYSTYLGGAGDDIADSIAVDGAGNAYVAGYTLSPDFPTKNAVQPTSGGGFDAFVAKLDPSGSALIYSTYLGGSATDIATGIAVDRAGNAYLTGSTRSANFPTTPGVFQPNKALGRNAFVAKLNQDGSRLLYSTFLGGSVVDRSQGIALDAAGNAYVAGSTSSTDFPITPGAFQTKFGGGPLDAFVAKLNATASRLVYSSYLGGNGNDSAFAIAVDQAGSAYVTGRTGSTNFPIENAIQSAFAGGTPNNPAGQPLDAFIAKLDPSGSDLDYATYFGGTKDEVGLGIATDRFGNAYMVGATSSSDFPITLGAFQTKFGGGTGDFGVGPDDAWVAKLGPEGRLVYSTYLGGSGDEFGNGIAVDAAGNAYIAGETSSKDFPTVNTLQAFTSKSLENGVVAVLNGTGTRLTFSTYLGGTGDDFSQAIALDRLGSVYVTGATTSADFPVKNALQPTNRAIPGNSNAFVVKLACRTEGNDSCEFGS